MPQGINRRVQIGEGTVAHLASAVHATGSLTTLCYWTQSQTKNHQPAPRNLPLCHNCKDVLLALIRALN